MRLITSTPQATAASTTPAPTSDEARLVACWLQPGGAGDVEALLADLADAPADDLADLHRIDAAAVHDRTLDRAQHLGGVHRGQAAAAASDRCANGIDDHHGAGLRHATSVRTPPVAAEGRRTPNCLLQIKRALIAGRQFERPCELSAPDQAGAHRRQTERGWVW
jgi:hypothetical protein